MTGNENVTEAQLKSYIEIFHKTLEETSKQYIPDEFRERLRHSSLLPAKIICYVSTQFGVGFEYLPAAETSIETVRGSSRIEDLFFRAPKKLSMTAPFVANGGIGTEFFDCNFEGDKFPIRLTNEKASAMIGKTSFIASGWSREIVYGEIFGNRKSEEWTESKAVARAKDEVLSALAEIELSKKFEISLDEFISKIKERTVLLLGKYDVEGLKRLEKIKENLKALGYDAILASDIPDNPYQTLEQKITVLGGVSRFIVIDDTEASGHIDELTICEQNDWVTIILRKGGKPSSSMTASSTIFSSVRKDFGYDPPDIVDVMKESTEWAEDVLITVKSQLDKIYPWRA